MKFTNLDKDLETPIWLFKWLDNLYDFSLDVAANVSNNKCEKYFSKDSLTREWEGSVFCHPPHDRNVESWLKKGFESSLKGNTVVMLLAARTDAAWFHEYCSLASRIFFLRGRIEFLNKDKELVKANFPTMIVVFENNMELKEPIISLVDSKNIKYTFDKSPYKFEEL